MPPLPATRRPTWAEPPSGRVASRLRKGDGLRALPFGLREHGSDMRQIAERLGFGGQRISLWRGDLTEATVDAVVNAANGQLQHGGGVAGALSRAAGPLLQVESDQLVLGGRSIPTGGAVVTGAGYLPALCVIHAVGPYGSDPNASDLLVQACWSALALAHRLELRSIALPAISSGIFGFPRDRCAQLLLWTVERFCREVPASSLTDFRFVIIDEPTLLVFHAEFLTRTEGAAPGPEAEVLPQYCVCGHADVSHGERGCLVPGCGCESYHHDSPAAAVEDESGPASRDEDAQ